MKDNVVLDELWLSVTVLNTVFTVWVPDQYAKCQTAPCPWLFQQFTVLLTEQTHEKYNLIVSLITFAFPNITDSLCFNDTIVR